MASNSISQAVVLATQTSTQRGRQQPLAELRTGGISLIKRTLLNLSSVGVRRFAVVIANESVRDHALADPQLAGLDVSWILNDERPDEDGHGVLRAAEFLHGDYLLVPCDRVFHPSIARGLLKHSGRAVNLAVTEAPDRSTEAAHRKHESTGFTGLAAARPLLWDALRAFEKQGRPLVLDHVIAELAARGEVARLVVGTAYWQPVGTAAGHAQAERLLIHALRKSVDGVVARHVNRPFSLAVTRILKNTFVRPNHVTAFSLGVSVVAALSAAHATAAQPGWLIVGALLWQLASMLDGVDGELARLKFAGSKFGEWFDTLTDDIGKFLFFLGSGVGAAAVLGNSIWFTLLALSVAMQVGMSYFIYRKLIQSGSGSHYALAWDGPPEEKPLWTRLITRIEFLSRRDAYVAIWLLLTLVGFVQGGIVLTLAVTSCVAISELVSPRRARVGFDTRSARAELPATAS